MNLPSHARPFDARMEHRKITDPAITTSQVIASFSQRAQSRTPYVTSIVLGTTKISANDEEYRFIVELSNDDFTTVETAAILSLGATEARLGGGPDNVAGDEYQMFWHTEVNGQSYKDWRIRLEVSGTSPSIGFAMRS